MPGKTFARNMLAVIAGIAGVVAVICIILILFGYKPFILTSPSMEPLFPKGSLVWADTKVAVDAVDIGDVLVYRAPSGNLVLHRLVGENLLQGDANTTAEEVKLSKTNFIGREAFHMPWVGDIISKILNYPWIIASAVGVLFILACLPCSNPRRSEQEIT